MALATTVSKVIHLSFAAFWTGSVLFAVVVHPTLDAASVRTVLGRLVTVSRASSVVLLLTGAHLAGVLYGGALFSGRGYYVLAMVVLWLALTALVEVAAARVDSAPTRSARALQTAAVVAVFLLLDAGVLLGA